MADQGLKSTALEQPLIPGRLVYNPNEIFPHHPFLLMSITEAGNPKRAPNMREARSMWSRQTEEPG